MLPFWYSLTIVAIVGSFIGSFIVCWAYRYNRGISIIFVKYSFCESCKKELSFWELIPILNYVFNKGKCRGCKEPYSPMSTCIEIIMAIYLPLIYFLIEDVTRAAIAFFLGCFVTFFGVVIADKLATARSRELENEVIEK